MANDMNELKKLRGKLVTEIEELRTEIKPLQDQLKVRNDRLETVEHLIALYEDNRPASPVPPIQPAPLPSSGARNGGIFTPTHVYWPAILEVLEKRGGSARSETIIDEVGNFLAGALRPADYERVPSGVVRWRNRVAWQRTNMINEGLLKKDSHRGIWEITEEGREWLREIKRKSA